MVVLCVTESRDKVFILQSSDWRPAARVFCNVFISELKLNCRRLFCSFFWTLGLARPRARPTTDTHTAQLHSIRTRRWRYFPHSAHSTHVSSRLPLPASSLHRPPQAPRTHTYACAPAAHTGYHTPGSPTLERAWRPQALPGHPKAASVASYHMHQPCPPHTHNRHSHAAVPTASPQRPEQ